MLKNTLKLIVVFVIGILGGVYANQVFTQPNMNASISIVETKEVIIEENSALENAVDKIEKAIVGIKTITKDGKTISGSGLVVTSDGLIIALSETVPSKGKFVFFVDDKTPDWQILKRNGDLVLIKVKMDDLKTVAFADFDSIRLGQRVFLTGVVFSKKPLKAVNEGLVRFFTSEYIMTNIIEKKTLSGSALFNIKGELLGLNTIDSEGKVTAIPITKIREFLGY